MSSHAPNRARVIPLRPATAAPAPPAKEPLWRDVLGDVLRRERLAQERTLKDVADAARISMPYLSELERGRKEASSEVLAAAARALGLGLAELLALGHGELVRRTGRRAGPGEGGAARRTGTKDAARRTGTADRPEREPGHDRSAAAGADDGTVTSVGELSARRRGPRAASRQGDVLLAA